MTIPNGGPAEVTARLTTGVAVEITCREGFGLRPGPCTTRDLGYGSLSALVRGVARLLEPGPPGSPSGTGG